MAERTSEEKKHICDLVNSLNAKIYDSNEKEYTIYRNVHVAATTNLRSNNPGINADELKYLAALEVVKKIKETNPTRLVDEYTQLQHL